MKRKQTFEINIFWEDLRELILQRIGDVFRKEQAVWEIKLPDGGTTHSVAIKVTATEEVELPPQRVTRAFSSDDVMRRAAGGSIDDAG